MAEEKRTISVTRALVLLKACSAQLNELSNIGNDNNKVLGTVYLQQGRTQPRVYGAAISTELADAEAVRSFNQVDDIIRNYTALKSRIVESNARTSVEVNGVTMTVAQAIELKNTLPAKRAFLQALKNTMSNANNTATKLNANIDKRVDEFRVSIAATLVQANPGADTSTEANRQADAYRETLLNEGEIKVIDPAGTAATIEALSKEIEFILTELDPLLTEVNSRTMIEAL